MACIYVFFICPFSTHLWRSSLGQLFRVCTLRTTQQFTSCNFGHITLWSFLIPSVIWDKLHLLYDRWGWRTNIKCSGGCLTRNKPSVSMSDQRACQTGRCDRVVMSKISDPQLDPSGLEATTWSHSTWHLGYRGGLVNACLLKAGHLQWGGWS